MNLQFFFAGLIAGLLLAAVIYSASKPKRRQCRALLSTGHRCVYLLPLDDDERVHEGPHCAYVRGREFHWTAEDENSVTEIEITRVR